MASNKPLQKKYFTPPYGMNFDIDLFICAIGLAFIIEGLPWALFPEAMRKVMLHMTLSPSAYLRRMGLIGIGAGLLIVWLVRG